MIVLKVHTELRRSNVQNGSHWAKGTNGQTWWLTSITSTLRRLRQKDCYDFEACLRKAKTAGTK